MGKLLMQIVSNTELSKRNILHHPPEPPYKYLMRKPSEGIYIGRTKILNVPYYWDPTLITNPHIVIVGITGSGKSFTIKTFLTRASFVWESNAVIIDWAGEYKDWVLQTGGKVISLGKGNYINLLDTGGMRPYDRIKQVIRTLEVLTDLGQYPEQRRLTEEAIEEAYRRAKFKMDRVEQVDELGRPLEPPTLKDVVKILEEKAQLGEYEYRAELDYAIHRLKNFTRPGQDFFANKSTIKLEELIHAGLVDLDLSGLPSEELRAMGALTVLQFIKEKMRREGFTEEKGVRLFVVLDEAWKISKDENSDVVMIVREGRKYGFSLIVASQNPTDISEVIFSNAGTNIIMKTKFERYLNYLQASLGFSEWVREQIINFGVGQAAVSVAFHTPEDFSNTFILQKIEGEYVEVDYFLNFEGVEGVEMGLVISMKRRELLEWLSRMGLDTAKAHEVLKHFEAKNRNMNVVHFVKLLEELGVDRKHIHNMLKEKGIDDATLINIFSYVDAKEMGAEKLDQLVMEDE